MFSKESVSDFALTPLPETCAIAFKEWEGVCEALSRGRQSLILRKGGIEEGPAGFLPEHDVFWLYPTRVHQEQQGLKSDAIQPIPPTNSHDGKTVELRCLARVVFIGHVDQSDRLEALDAFHVWTGETVEKRFQYRHRGLWVLGIQVFRGDRATILPVTPEQAGCKSWVPLETALPTAGLVPVLGLNVLREEMNRLREVVNPPARP
ncbi:MAG: DUF1802 family protein [Isosphaeraceae bacterium]